MGEGVDGEAGEVRGFGSKCSNLPEAPQCLQHASGSEPGLYKGTEGVTLRSLEVANSPNFLTFLLSFFSLFFKLWVAKFEQ